MLPRFLISGLTAAVLALSPMLPAAAEQLRVASLDSLESAPVLHSNAVLIINAQTGVPVFSKNADNLSSIASITKLMTAMVALDSNPDLDAALTISDDEVDRLKRTTSRLPVGTTLTRREMLLLALMSSENRAAHVLARSALPGGTGIFVSRMNQKARQLGMTHTRFYDPTGLNSGNVSTAQDLAKMVAAAYRYPLIRQFTTTQEHDVYVKTRLTHYKNSNALVREGEWQIGLSKTGYIQEAGRCLVMHATVGTTPLIMVFLDAGGSAARTNDARAIRTWLEGHPGTWLAG